MGTRRRRRWHLSATIFLFSFCHCGVSDVSPLHVESSDGVGGLVTPTASSVTASAPGSGDSCVAPGAGEPRRLASIDDACGELTARKLLQFVSSEYQATLGVQGLYRPSTSLAIRVDYRGGEILCYPAEPAPPETARPDVPSSISVVMEIRFVSEDGAFNETLVTPVTGGWSDASFCHTTAPDELQGSFEPQPGQNDAVERVVFGGSFAGPSCWGQIATSSARQGSSSAAIVPVAYWRTSN